MKLILPFIVAVLLSSVAYAQTSSSEQTSKDNPTEEQERLDVIRANAADYQYADLARLIGQAKLKAKDPNSKEFISRLNSGIALKAPSLSISEFTEIADPAKKPEVVEFILNHSHEAYELRVFMTEVIQK